jgi:hypothetical protein
MRMIFLVAFLFAGAADAATPLSPKMADAFHKKYPNVKINPAEVAVGDLNKDGQLDFATFVGEVGSDQDLPIAVFLAQADGSYALQAESAPVMWDPRGQRSLEVKNQSLFLRRSGSNGCCSDWSEKYQFALRDGALVLIGEDSHQYPKGESDDESDTSVNYLTGEALFWRKLDGKRKEMRISFKQPSLMALHGFSLKTHDDQEPKELHGRFDDQLHFVKGK